MDFRENLDHVGDVLFGRRFQPELIFYAVIA
jgi:hypothetical protein